MRTGEAAASPPQAPPHEAEAASSSPGTRAPPHEAEAASVPWDTGAHVLQRTHCAELPGPGCPKPRDPGSDLLLTWVTAAAAAQSPRGLGKGRAELGSRKAP